MKRILHEFSIILFTTVLFIFVFSMNGRVFAADDDYYEVISLSSDKESFYIEDYIKGYSSPEIYVDTGEAVSWSSTNEKAILIEKGYSSSASLKLVNPGSATIIATDSKGATASCTVTALETDLVVKTSNISMSVSESGTTLIIDSGYGLKYKSSDSSVFKVIEYSDEYCDLEFQKPGTAYLTITDYWNKTKKVNVTITEAEWDLSKSSITASLAEEEQDITIKEYYEDLGITASSSDSKIIEANYSTDYYDNIRIYLKAVGNAVITVKDKYGKTRKCKVKVTSPPLTLSDSSVTFKNYSIYDDSDLYERICTEGYYNDIASVKSENSKIAKVERKLSDDGDYYAYIYPVSAGTTNVIITDQYGQTATVKVSITSKFMDDIKYMADLDNSYVDDYTYGDSSLCVYCPITATVYTIVNGKKYYGEVDEDGYYIIRGVPILPVGKSYTVTIEKGKSSVSFKADVVQQGNTDITISIKDQVFSGKEQTPVATVKSGTVLLKKGTDYNIKFTNNKNVGTAKAILDFKGNYKGSKAAYFKILPKSTRFSSVSGKKKSIIVKWKAAKQAAGYQIQYSRKKDFRSAKTVTIKNKKTKSRKIKKLKGRKKYYVRIRTYQTVKGTNYYSLWSKVKTVKTKK